MADVFLSYSRQDRSRADAIVEALRGAGIDVWHDLDIAPGMSWRREIEDALENSNLVIVLWSPASVESEWVRAEAQLASDRKKLIPVIIGPVEIPLGFRNIQHLDLRKWSGDPKDPALAHLVEIARERAQEPQPSAPPKEDQTSLFRGGSAGFSRKFNCGLGP